MKVQFIYETTCPNAEATRKLLAEVLNELNLKIDVEEIDKSITGAPNFAQQYGSPSILVNGKDVVDSVGKSGNACRIYENSDGKLTGIPPRDSIVKALQKT